MQKKVIAALQSTAPDPPGEEETVPEFSATLQEKGPNEDQVKKDPPTSLRHERRYQGTKHTVLHSTLCRPDDEQEVPLFVEEELVQQKQDNRGKGMRERYDGSDTKRNAGLVFVESSLTGSTSHDQEKRKSEHSTSWVRVLGFQGWTIWITHSWVHHYRRAQHTT